MVAPMVLLKAFPELRHCLYEKKFGVVHAGKYEVRLDFSHPSLWAMKPFLKLVAGIDFTYPLQIDRVALDQALFEKALLSPYCAHLESAVVEVDYDAAADSVRRIVLDDGSEIATSHLFDASGQRTVLANLLDLSRQQIDEPYFLVQAYYGVERDSVRPARQPWQDELNIVRLYREQNGIDGIATLIPLGDRLSLRVSAPLSQARTAAGSDAESKEIISPEALLALAQAALQRKGFHYGDLYPEQLVVHSEIDDQYMMDRAYGANWLLTGMAYCNTLVTTAISADTACEALHIGPGFLKNPAQMGALYQHYMNYYTTMHQSWHTLATHDAAMIGKSEIKEMIDQYLHANGAQFNQSLRLLYHESPIGVGWQAAVASMDSRYRLPHVAPYSTIQMHDTFSE